MRMLAKFFGKGTTEKLSLQDILTEVGTPVVTVDADYMLAIMIVLRQRSDLVAVGNICVEWSATSTFVTLMLAQKANFYSCYFDYG